MSAKAVNKVSRSCNEPGCPKKAFAKRKCAGHYQQLRRKGAITGPVREYGAGNNRISGAVDDGRWARLRDYAQEFHGGSVYAAVQEIISAFIDDLEPS